MDVPASTLRRNLLFYRVILTPFSSDSEFLSSRGLVSKVHAKVFQKETDTFDETRPIFIFVINEFIFFNPVLRRKLRVGETVTVLELVAEK